MRAIVNGIEREVPPQRPGRSETERRKTDLPDTYAQLIAATRQAALARFHSWQFKPETKSIDPATASLDQLSAALTDCRTCAAVEYPETDDGTYYALARTEELKAAVQSRFPERAQEIFLEAGRRARAMGGLAHGYK